MFSSSPSWRKFNPPREYLQSILTALLIMAPLAEQDTAIEVQGFLVSKPYVEIRLHLMHIFGSV